MAWQSQNGSLARILRAIGVGARSGSAHPDAGLLAACKRFDELERSKVDLLVVTGEGELTGSLVAALHSEQIRLLDAICDVTPSTLAGHRARAVSFLLFDGEELSHRASTAGMVEDRLLDAITRDLALVGHVSLSDTSVPQSGVGVS